MTVDHVSQPRRIAVIGTSGSGKSTLARQIAAAIGAPHIELDALFHQPNWVPADRDAFRAEVSAAIAGPAWVTDGNYSNFLRDIIWPAADEIVWLDYPVRIVVWRLFLRTVRRGLKREVLWNGNRESLRMNFLSRDSLFLCKAGMSRLVPKCTAYRVSRRRESGEPAAPVATSTTDSTCGSGASAAIERVDLEVSGNSCSSR